MLPRPPRYALALALILAATPSAGSAQLLRLLSLEIPRDATPGPWVSYRVVSQSRNLPSRGLTQRVAIVSAEGIGDEAGVWVELKTVDPQTGTRIDRGFYGRGPADDESPTEDQPAPALRLLRVQRLHPDGKLFEYPPGSSAALRADEEVSTLDLFEVDESRPPAIDTLGVDTLRIGRKTLPTLIVRKQWVGSDSWSEGADSSRINRVLLTLTQHLCPGVPITGFTQSVFEVRTAQFALTDSLSQHPLPPDPAQPAFVSQATLTLGDMGGGAVPEVTQEPEMAPDAGESESPPGIIR